MSHDPSPWDLPGLKAFLGGIDTALDQGIAAVAADPAIPLGFEQAVRSHMRARFPSIEEIVLTADRNPLLAIAEHLGALPRTTALRSMAFDQTLAIIHLPTSLDARELETWRCFLSDYAEVANAGDPGLAVLVVGAPEGLGIQRIEWTGALRRGDLVIWAEEHLPMTRSDLAADLAVSLAVEVCGWRLDLAAELVRAAVDDLADVTSWLSRREEEAMQGGRRVGKLSFDCPLALRRNSSDEVLRRIWRAHLSALFPWLEQQRLDLVVKHRSQLRVDQHLRSSGVTKIDEIELGALSWQLAQKLTARERDRIERLARIRNALAHRKPALSDDLRLCL